MAEEKFFDGKFLIAESELRDPHFIETVVLMISHDVEGAFGLVINRKTQVTLGEAAPRYRESPFAAMPLFVGGPVEQEYLFTLHSGLPEGEGGEHQRNVVEGLVFEPNFQAVEDSILSRPDAMPPYMRLYAGYSGWAPGQLESEIEEGAWVVLPGDADLVFRLRPEEGWKEALRRKGGIYWALAETGYKPSIN